MMKVYKYGTKPPEKDTEWLVREQLRLADRYHRDVLRIENGRRLCRHELRMLDPEFAAAYVAVQNAANGDRKAALAALFAAEKAVRTRLAWMLQRTTEVAAEERRVARAHASEAGLYWGTYLLVEAAVDAAAKTPEYGTKRRAGKLALLHDDSRTGEGSVGVQIQNGMSAEEIFGDDTRIRIAPRPVWGVKSGGLPQLPGAGKRQWGKTHLYMRVGSEGRTPVFAAWKLYMHRPLPDESRIKCAAMHVRRIGPREEWYCTITVDMPEPQADKAGRGVIGIDVGWRRLRDGSLRVAAWADDAGHERSIVLPPAIREAFQVSHGLRAIRDRMRDIFLPRLRSALDASPTPAWLRERTRTLARWESCERLHELRKEWRRQGRYNGDKRAYSMLEGYCYRDWHLWAWEDSQRKKTVRRRNEGYRCLAADLAKTYDVLVLERFDLRTMADYDNNPESRTEYQYARAQAADSVFRDACKSAFLSRGKTVARVSARNTTRRCSVCGVVETFDAARSLTHVCENGHEWDQDVNAGHNLVAAYRERPGDAEILGTARKSKKTGKIVAMAGGKFRRAKAAKVAKQRLGDTAREVEGKGAESRCV